MAFNDYYAILGINKAASAEEIKRAYRLLARRHHPDLHPEQGKVAAGEKFKEINEAYQVLSDAEKRKKYDQLGPGWESAQEARPGREPRETAGFSDFFEELFGDAGRHGFSVQDVDAADPDEGRDVEAELPLSLEDAFHGGEKKMSLSAPVLCAACGGLGRKGRGFCSQCGGVGESRGQKHVTVNLPKHVRDGVKLRLRGQGSPGRGGKAPGDLYLRVKLLPHPAYKVSGSDLETTVTVMPWVVALGGEATVASLDGPVRIRIPAGTHTGRPLRLAGKGLGKDDGSRGDLYAVVRVDIPEKMTEKMESLYREMKEAGA
ncbi:MAG: J domain-containing protein [Elusimicrobia bacterium]|nr:J domain-containing protein [Elusimicrobiota bacterium]